MWIWLCFVVGSECFMLRTPYITSRNNIQTIADTFDTLKILPEIEKIIVTRVRHEASCVHLFAQVTCNDGKKLWGNGSGSSMMRACEACTNDIFFTMVHQNILADTHNAVFGESSSTYNSTRYYS